MCSSDLLHGHELTLDITPVQASASWAIGWKKDGFAGHQALRAQRESKNFRSLKALVLTDRGIPRAGMKVLSADGAEIGIVTSGTFSPTLKNGIALALIEPNYVVGSEVFIEIRNRTSAAKVSELPLVPSHVR